VRHHERRLRHDVMAHIHHLGDQAPAARPFIHLGATSCFVTDNADLIVLRDACRLLLGRLRDVLLALRAFAAAHADLPTLAYTHFQPAQLTTVGKRATLWCWDFVRDLEEVEGRSNISNWDDEGGGSSEGSESSGGGEKKDDEGGTSQGL